jgi:hypothetical protein
VERKFVPFSVKVCDVVPATAETGDRLARAGAGLLPVPLRVTTCGLPATLSVMVKEAVRVPGPDGVKVKFAVHCPAGATEPPHVFVREKSAALGPLNRTLSISNVAPLVLVRMTP